MALLENRQTANLRACEQLVESVLTHVGVDPAQSRLVRSEGEGPAWGLTYGSAHLYVFLTSSLTSEDNYIQVVAPVFRPPEDAGAELWRRLLELNGRALTGAAFGLRDGEVVVSADRNTRDLDHGEVEDMIRRIGDYADLYDEALVSEFGGVRHCDLALHV